LAVPGKLEVIATKPMATQRDLSLAYSPGVAVPVLAIAEDESRAYDYTTKGNFVAVITNGTAILGLGNRGALAAKPVMEGKAVLFKRFADIDSIDLEVDSEDPDEIINCVKLLGKGWGGINLEDIKAPECFVIEQRLRELMDIPVFHDDQHGTAIIAAAGLLNALDLTGREIATTKLVCNGAGAAGIACLELLKSIGFKPENLILCDTKGVIYQGRTDGMNQWKSGYAIKTSKRTLAEAFEGADVAFGLSVKGAFTPAMIKSMAAKPIIFAMANPDAEISPEEVAAVRDDAIMATGPVGLSKPDQQCARLPLHLPRRARRARLCHQHGNENRCCARARSARPRGRTGRSDERLWRAAKIRIRLHHSGAVRSAADLLRAARGRTGRDGYRRRTQADRRHGCLPPPAECATGPDRGNAGARI
jgi:malic enzyme